MTVFISKFRSEQIQNKKTQADRYKINMNLESTIVFIVSRKQLPKMISNIKIKEKTIENMINL